MARYQRRLDAGAFDQLVSRFLAPALGVAQQMLSDRALAEDAVQETFLRLVRGRERYLPSKSFSPWFYAILRNICRDMLRRRQRRQELHDRAAASVDRRVHEPASAPFDVLGLLDALPAEARAVLELRVVQGLAFRDIAAALGISEEAAKKRGQRALRRLRELASARQARDGAERQTSGRAPREAAAARLSR